MVPEAKANHSKKSGKVSAGKALGDVTTSASSSSSSKGTSSDKIEISSLAGNMKAYKAQISAMGDLRSEKIEALKQEIESGQYNPSSEDIADAMIKNAFSF